MRTTFDDPAGDCRTGFPCGRVGVVGAAHPRVVGYAARVLRLARGRVVVAGPLPDVSRDVVQSEPVWVGSSRRVRCPHTRPGSSSARGTLPARYLPWPGLPGSVRRPRRTPLRRVRRVPRTPTRPRWGSASRPSARRRGRPPRPAADGMPYIPPGCGCRCSTRTRHQRGEALWVGRACYVVMLPILLAPLSVNHSRRSDGSSVALMSNGARTSGG